MKIAIVILIAGSLNDPDASLKLWVKIRRISIICLVHLIMRSMVGVAVVGGIRLLLLSQSTNGHDLYLIYI
jgi:hypothetical protein